MYVYTAPSEERKLRQDRFTVAVLLLLHAAGSGQPEDFDIHAVARSSVVSYMLLGVCGLLRVTLRSAAAEDEGDAHAVRSGSMRHA